MQGLADTGGADDVAVVEDGVEDLDDDAALHGEPLEIGGCAGAPASEVEVVADPDLSGVEDVGDDAGDEVLGRERCELVAEGEGDRVGDAERSQELELAFG